MKHYLSGCALLMALLPATVWAQASSCEKPDLPDTEITGWHLSEWGIIGGTAHYRIASTTPSDIDKVTLDLKLGHVSDDESHAKGLPAPRELQDLMYSGFQVRFELKDRSRPRDWDADDAVVLFDGKRFPTRMSVSGAPNHTKDIAADWDSWYSDKDLLAAMESANEMEVRMLDTARSTHVSYTFDVSSFKDIRARLVPYWRCTSVPYHHSHRH